MTAKWLDVLRVEKRLKHRIRSGILGKIHVKQYECCGKKFREYIKMVWKEKKKEDRRREGSARAHGQVANPNRKVCKKRTKEEEKEEGARLDGCVVAALV